MLKKTGLGKGMAALLPIAEEDVDPARDPGEKLAAEALDDPGIGKIEADSQTHPQSLLRGPAHLLGRALAEGKRAVDAAP